MFQHALGPVSEARSHFRYNYDLYGQNIEYSEEPYLQPPPPPCVCGAGNFPRGRCNLNGVVVLGFQAFLLSILIASPLFVKAYLLKSAWFVYKRPARQRAPVVSMYIPMSAPSMTSKSVPNQSHPCDGYSMTLLTGYGMNGAENTTPLSDSLQGSKLQLRASPAIKCRLP